MVVSACSPKTKRQSRRAPGEFGMYLKGQWYRLAIRPERIPHNDPVKRLDVSLLQDHLLAPILRHRRPAP